MLLADREILGTGHNGYGTYCSKCGSWKCGYLEIDLTYDCLDCGSKEFTVFSPFKCIFVKETS